jgi:murein DD-endopeptidase MepM/ murein hydrolase activator NlpD
MRYQASMGAQVMIVVERGEVLQITGNATNGFYPVNYDGLRAFMSVDLLTETSEPLSKRSGGGSGVSVGVGAVLGSLTPRISQPFGQTAFSMGAGSWMYGYAAGLGVPLAHPGIDYSMPHGTRLYIPVSGTVVYAGGTGWFRDSRGDGAGRGELRIRTDNGHEIIFGHMSWIPLFPGQRVVAGELAGLSGSFNGDHLHLEVRVPGNTSSGWQAIDPSRYFAGATSAYRNQVTGV